jgi:hypothetical protein
MISASGLASPAAATSSRTSPGASASMIEVSTRPACASGARVSPAAASMDGRTPACHTWQSRPSARSVASASPIGLALPPCPLTISIAGQCSDA